VAIRNAFDLGFDRARIAIDEDIKHDSLPWAAMCRRQPQLTMAKL
jgi:hypothetical protein